MHYAQMDYDNQMPKPITIDPKKYFQNAYLLFLKKKSSTTHINSENFRKQLNRLIETVREKERQEDNAEKNVKKRKSDKRKDEQIELNRKNAKM